MTTPLEAPFRDLERLAFLLKLALGAYILVAIGSIYSEWLQIDLLEGVRKGARASDATIAANDSRQAIFSWLSMAVFSVTAILFLRWTFLATGNARVLGARDMKFTPAWAVGWYFVPVLMLWKPYQALKETFKASNPQGSGVHPDLLPIWWTLWLVASLTGQLLFKSVMKADTVNALITTSWLSIVSDVVDVPLGIVVIILVSTLQSWQTQSRGSIGLMHTNSSMKESTGAATKGPDRTWGAQHSSTGYFETAWKEFDTDQRDLELWARCYSEAGGDESKAKAVYLSKRARFIAAQSVGAVQPAKTPSPSDRHESGNAVPSEAHNHMQPPTHDLPVGVTGLGGRVNWNVWLILALLAFGVFVITR